MFFLLLRRSHFTSILKCFCPVVFQNNRTGIVFVSAIINTSKKKKLRAAYRKKILFRRHQTRLQSKLGRLSLKFFRLADICE